ncbi:MAG: RNA-binding protein [Nitrososphaera sp.]
MIDSSAGNSLQLIDGQLKDVQRRRELLIRGSRDAIAMASKSIIFMHKGKFDEAVLQMENARSTVDQLRPSAQSDLYKYVAVAEQELAEAYCLLAIMNNKPIPSAESLGISGPSYLTGILDCVGEVKRLVYDRMRTGREQDAESLFGVMEELYDAVYPFAVYDNIVAGLRKKLDVARMLIEDVRASVTEERRRTTLIAAFDRLRPGSA